ncbi:MAG: hypothetical protein OXC28_02500 [Defluviicoccus sp.]|nr:hypothetical protein [Defluviicoccus sp.]
MRIALLAALMLISIVSFAKGDDTEFNIGDSFDTGRLPYISDEDRDRIEAAISNSHARAHFVLAISESGKMGASRQQDINTKDRIRRAMQSCEHKSQSACGLVIVNGHFVSFENSPRQLSYPVKFDSASVPFLLYRELDRLRSNYAGKGQHRALALNWTGAFGYSTERRTKELAQKKALSICEKHSDGWGKCFLYDVNGRVVFRPNTSIFSSQ